MITLAQSALVEGASAAFWCRHRVGAHGPHPLLFCTQVDWGPGGQSLQVFAVPHNRSSQHPTALLHTHPSTPPPDGVRAPIPSPTAPVLPCGCGALFLLPGCACLRAVGVTVTRASTPVSQISAEPHWSFYIRSEQPRRAPPLFPASPLQVLFHAFLQPWSPHTLHFTEKTHVLRGRWHLPPQASSLIWESTVPTEPTSAIMLLFRPSLPLQECGFPRLSLGDSDSVRLADAMWPQESSWSPTALLPTRN